MTSSNFVGCSTGARRAWRPCRKATLTLPSTSPRLPRTERSLRRAAMVLDPASWRRSAGARIGLYQKSRSVRWASLSAACLLLAALHLAVHPPAVLSQVKAPAAILVGATVSITGPFSSEVAPFKKMMETWAEMVNAKGGISLKQYAKDLPLK